jgi:iron complex transport system ATP-binding protein
MKPPEQNAEPQNAIEARDLAFAYRKGEPVLRGVSLAGRAGRLMCLLGPNGGGKTTLLRCLMGWLKPSAGSALLAGRDARDLSPRQLARLVAYVPQTPQSAFAFSVGEIVLMGRFSHAGLMGLACEQDLAVARAAMRMTGVLDLEDRTLDELSGGQAQCAMIARALAQQPSVILMDEPTSHLDIRNQLLIHRMMQRLAHDWGMAVVCVSHDVNLAARFADELVLLRDGRVAAAGSPSEVIRREALEEVYGVGIELVPAGDGAPIVVGH